MKPRPEPVRYVNHLGLEIDPHITERAPEKPKSRSAKPSAYHRGWRVEGHMPGALEAAKRVAQDACYEWSAMDPVKRREAIANGIKEPKPWDEANWRANGKATAVRLRPLESYAAAVDCSQLAVKQGWTDVRIIELRKGDPSNDFP